MVNPSYSNWSIRPVGERRIVQIVLCCLQGLLVPISSAIVDGPVASSVEKPSVFQLIHQPAAGKSSVVQVVQGFAQGRGLFCGMGIHGGSLRREGRCRWKKHIELGRNPRSSEWFQIEQEGWKLLPPANPLGKTKEKLKTISGSVTAAKRKFMLIPDISHSQVWKNRPYHPAPGWRW